MTKTESKKLDREIEKAYYRLAAGQKISIMDIPKVFAESRRAIAAGSTLDQSVRAAILMYCMAA